MRMSNAIILAAGLAATAGTAALNVQAAESEAPPAGESKSRRGREPKPVELTPEQTEAIRALLVRLQDQDPAARMRAAQEAGPIGYIAIPSLQPLLSNQNPGVRKATEEALSRIVHHAARPGAAKEAENVNFQLTQWILHGRSLRAQIIATRMLQYTGTEKNVPLLSNMLSIPQVRDEALLTLERIPGRASTRAMERALGKASEEFRPNIEAALRRRKETMRTVGEKARK